MMTSVLAAFLLTAADHAAAAAPPAPPPAEARMAIDELGMPVDKKDKKKGKGVLTGGQDCDGADSACRTAACSAQHAAIVVDTYGGHGAHGVAAKPAAADAVAVAAGSESPSVAAVGCPVPAGMAINEKGTVGTKTKKPAK